MISIINLFLTYSILGNIFERILMYFVDTTYISGFMGSIFTPIYGIAAIILVYLHDKIKIKNKLIKFIIEFFMYSLILTFLELVGGLLIEKIFNKVYWNYDKFKYNLGLYISLESSILWGIMSIILVYIIQPLYKKIESRIPKFVTILVSIAFSINLLFAIIVK